VSATPASQKVNYQALLNVCKHLSINATRENTARHIQASVGFCIAIRVCFHKSGKNYSDFEKQWLPDCVNEIRRLYDQGNSLASVNSTIRDTQSRSRSFVYRRTKTDFFRFLCKLLDEVLCKGMVKRFMEGDSQGRIFEWPDVLMIHRDYMRNIFRIVNALNPHTDDFDYGATLADVGCTRATVDLIKTIEARFNEDPSYNMAVAESGIEALDECQHMVVSAFFHILREHAGIREISLSGRTREMQIEAVQRRMCSTSPGSEFPTGICLLNICGAIGCHKRKTPTTQERGLRYLGCVAQKVQETF